MCVYPLEVMVWAHEIDTRRGQMTLDALELEFTGSCEQLDMRARNHA